MQKEFTVKFIKSNCGCYNLLKLIKAFKRNGKYECLESEESTITYEDIISSDIPVNDKYWFFCKNVFTKEQNRQISIGVAEIVLPLYEEKYPKNKAPRESIEAAKLYIDGHISSDELTNKKEAAADAAYNAGWVAFNAAEAAEAAADAADGDAADAAYNAAACAADAAAYADACAYAYDTGYKQSLIQFLFDFCKQQP